MEIEPIETGADHAAVLKEIDGLMDAESGTPEGCRPNSLAILVQVYEAEHFPMELPIPASAIKS